MIYGAYGYTGKLMVKESLKAKMSPVLAGRDSKKVLSLANEHGLEPRVFDLKDASKFLEDIEVVVNCAGPFSKTFSPMVEACISTKTHYIDITGEVSVFEKARNLDKAAKDAKIIICPGGGFDVVPTDCLALKLKHQMPDAVELELGFDGFKTPSAGTAKTVLENIASGSLIRKDGELITIPSGSDTKEIDFGKGDRLAMAIPWGDLSTAYTTTSIPNIKVFTSTSRSQLKQLRNLSKVSGLLSTPWVQRIMQKLIQWKVKGPDADAREKEKGLIWGMVKNKAGETVVGRVQTNNGYIIAAVAPILMTQKLLSSSKLNYGHTTPALLMGEDFITQLDGSSDWQLS